MSVTFCLPGSPCAPGAKKQGPGTASRMTEGPQCCGETAECRNVTKFQPGLVPLLFQGRGSQVHIEDLQVFPSCSPCTGFLLGVLLSHIPVQNPLLLGSTQIIPLLPSSWGSLSWLRFAIQVLGFVSPVLGGSCLRLCSLDGEIQRSRLAGTSILPWFPCAVVDWSLQCWLWGLRVAACAWQPWCCSP